MGAKLRISECISIASKASAILCILMAGLVWPRSLQPRDGCFMSSFISPLMGEENFVFPKEALPTESGYLTVNATSKARMFYAFYEAIEPTTSIAHTPIILWLQGGPGCSSMIGNFYELGPWRVSSDQKLHKNQSPWNQKFGVLFIDSPVGTGYSIAEKFEDIPVHHNQVAEHLFEALKEFYSSNTDFKNRVLFVTGESYAGKYVPALGHYILMKSKMGQTDMMKYEMGLSEDGELNPFDDGGINFPFKLGGLVIGNGITDPEVQVQSYANVTYNFGLIDGKQRRYIEEFAEQIVGFIHKQQWFDAYQARTALMDWIQNVTGIATLLDMRRSVPYHCSPDGMEFLAPFLNQNSVKAALNAEQSTNWVSCNLRVRRAMANDTMKSVKWMVDKALEEVPVLLYQGQYDIKDGVVSNEEWMRTLRWGGIGKFFDTERSLWYVGDKLAGYWKSHGNLSHVVLLGAGHEVPADQSLHSQKMVEKWIAEHLTSSAKVSDTLFQEVAEPEFKL
ncbi:hypothetical protein SUGI_0845790 [Cryptomeria japonica]|uniref:serine carboxypeptidase-like 50 n=1 Tax=Cryptomeria japonica TaxID=3369 RepID=UPI002414B56D|nr:serine carboxypeptidase-like 50 [Cryptomeria japonica]GLJ40885.1 hypothetical protein SUGI_0845790 [Cryptomeria japonica]